MSFIRSILVLTATFTLAACAPALEPLRIRASDLGKGTAPIDSTGRPVIVEFQVGDTVPLDFTFAGEMVELVPEKPALVLRVRQHFFARIDGKGLKTSLDGLDFDRRPAAPGRFQFGFGVTAAGPKVDIHVETPRHSAQ